MMNHIKSTAIGGLTLTFLLLPATLLPLFSPYPFLALLPGLGLIALIGIGSRPEFGLYAIVFLIPFYIFRDIGGSVASIKIDWVLGLLLLVVVLFRLLTERSFLTRFRSNLWPFILGFLVVSLLSTLLSEFSVNAGKQVVMNLIAILFFTLTITLVPREGVMRHLPAVIAISVSLGAALAVIGNLAELKMFTMEDRGTGGAMGANVLALQIIFGLPFMVFWLTHARRFSLRLLALGMILINLAAMVLSSSRSGALVLGALALALVTINLHGIKPSQLGLAMVGGAAVILVAGASLPESFWERQETLFAEQPDRSLSRRASYLDVAVDAIAQRPLLGHGPGTFKDLYARSDWAIYFHRRKESDRRPAHNSYIEVLVGTGFIGAIFYFSLLGVAMRNFITARQRLIAQGDQYHSDLVTHYLVAFSFLLLYLTMYSNVFQRYLLLCLGISQLWYRYGNEGISGTDPVAMPAAVPGHEPTISLPPVAGTSSSEVAP